MKPSLCLQVATALFLGASNLASASELLKHSRSSSPSEGSFRSWREERVFAAPQHQSDWFPLTGNTGDLTLYSIGDPTSEEQLFLEWINRARANPAAEGERLRVAVEPEIVKSYASLDVDLDLMLAQFAAILPAPPLAMNEKLTAAARRHSKDMLVVPQGHTGSDGSTPGTRVTEAGYVWTMVGENVFSSAKSLWHAHAAFQVDWGGDASTGGMQSPPGHREAIHDPDFREVGIGVLKDSSEIAGPIILTQDFGTGRNPSPLLTGVAYFDANTNNFYDIGEGIEGVKVTAAGSSFFALTAGSGGYALPLPGNGNYVVTFSLAGTPSVQMTATVSNRANDKLDFVPSYSPAFIIGPPKVALSRTTRFSFGPVAGAKEYQWKLNRRVRVTDPEGAEDGLTKLIAQTSPGYNVIDSAIKSNGRFSFHLAQPDSSDQLLTLDRTFRPSATSELRFRSRLGWASTAQVARAQISIDGWKTWRDVWTQDGSGGSGERSFNTRTVSLGAYAGEEIQLRFMYGLVHLRYFNQTDPDVGFYIDDIFVTDAEELVDSVSGTANGDLAFSVSPTETGDYALRGRAKVGRDVLPWGPFKLISTTTDSEPEIRIEKVQLLGGSQLQFDFTSAPAGNGAVRLQSSPAVDGPWITESSATIQNTENATQFRALLPRPNATARFFRMIVN